MNNMQSVNQVYDRGEGKERKKMNTYLKYGGILMGFMLAGAIVGVVLAIAGSYVTSVQTGTLGITEFLRTWMLAELLGLLAVAVVLGEFCLARIRKLGTEAANATEEEGDVIEYRLEKATAWGTMAVNMALFLTLIIMATGYSISYIQTLSGHALKMLLLSFLVVIVNSAYNGFWGVRLIRQIQKTDPTKKGDPASTRFMRQWVESCDEAERDMIYRAGFDSYTFMNKWIAVPIFVTCFAHFLWETGILAIVITVVIWIMLQFSYMRSCIRQKKDRCGV